MQKKDIHDFLSEMSVANFSDRSIRRLLENRENVRGLLELVSAELAELIDFEHLVLINRSLLPATLREQEADIVYRVPFKSDGDEGAAELLLYLLIEHQSTVDATMGFRVLFYMMLIWDAERRRWAAEKVPRRERVLPPILPVVFYTGERRWEKPLTLEAMMNLPVALSRFVPRFDILFLNLKGTDKATLTEAAHPFGWLMRVLQQKDSDKASISRALRETLTQLETLDAVDSGQRREAIMYLVLLIQHRRSKEEQEELIELIDRHTSDMEVAPMAETMAEFLFERGIAQGIERGIEQGIERGIERGREQGACQTAIKNITAVLNARFPDRDIEPATQQLETLSNLEHLEQLLLTAVKADSFQAFLQALEL